MIESLVSQKSTELGMVLQAFVRVNIAPLGSCLLHNSWWYRRSVGLWESGSLPPASSRKSNVVSIGTVER